MLRTSRKFVALAFIIVALMVPAIAGAQMTVRGRLQRLVPNGWFPAQGLVVTVRGNYPGGPRSNPTYSGPDGMYYLYNVPQGAYVLEVWVPNARAPFLSILVGITYAPTPNGYLCDIAPVNVP